MAQRKSKMAQRKPRMAQWKPDPTFYPSPRLAMQAPPERWWQGRRKRSAPASVRNVSSPKLRIRPVSSAVAFAALVYLGPAAAMSLIYFLIILLLSWIFYTVMTQGEEAA